MPNAYTFQIIDPKDLVSSAIEADITRCAQYVIGLISHYLDWQGTLDVAIEIRPAADLTWSDANGLLPTLSDVRWDGSAWINDTLVECRTGVDGNPAQPDAGCTIYLGDDGTIRNYGFPVWFDPNPLLEVDPHVPAGTHDFVGILTHEFFHALGFYQVTAQWQAQLHSQGNLSYFVGPHVSSLIDGGGLAFIPGTDHYGDLSTPSVGITRGLMFEYGNYEQNRLDIGRIDLAVLADLGQSIKTSAGLPLFELDDRAPNVTGTAKSEQVFGDYHANVLHGGAGNDALLGGSGNDTLYGDGGADGLYGEGGADIFAFTITADSLDYAMRSDGAKLKPDVISDFTSGVDKIDLSAIDAVAGTGANDAFTFIGANAFTHHAGELRCELHNGVAQIYADVDGDGVADLHILANTPVILAADFVL